MPVYQRPDSPFWYYRFEFQRRCYRGSTGAKNERDARQFERTERARIKARADKPAARLSLKAACARYIDEAGKHHKRSDQLEWSFAWLMHALGAETPLAAIGNSEIAAIIARRRGESVRNVRAATQARRAGKGPAKARAEPKLVSPARVNRSVTEPLRRLMRRAGEHWDEPVQKIRWAEHILKEPKERVRELRAPAQPQDFPQGACAIDAQSGIPTADEEARLMAALPPRYRAIIAFLLASGCRVAEALALDYEDIDWAARAYAITAKGGDRQQKILTTEIRALLWGLRDDHTGPVFKAATGERLAYEALSSAFRRAARRAGIKDIHLHDLRHTHATRLLRKTGNLALVKRSLGHANIESTMRYAHVIDEDLRAGLEAMAETRQPVTKTVTVATENVKNNVRTKT